MQPVPGHLPGLSHSKWQPAETHIGRLVKLAVGCPFIYALGALKCLAEQARISQDRLTTLKLGWIKTPRKGSLSRVVRIPGV